MNIKNYTPHDIVVYSDDKKTVLATYTTLNASIRVSERTLVVGSVNGHTLSVREFTGVVGLPEQEEGVFLIVSAVVLNACANLHPERNDLIAPDTGTGAVRNEKGQIIGTIGFITSP